MSGEFVFEEGDIYISRQFRMNQRSSHMQQIHPTALVDERAKIGNGVEIGPFSVVVPDVTVGDRCILKSHVTL